MTDDLLDRLADVELSTRTPDLASVERRSHAILRNRRSVRGGAIGLAVVATLAIGTVLPLGSQNGSPLAQLQGPLPFGALPASASTGGACNQAFVDKLPRDEWASAPGITESASLIADPSLPLTRLEVTRDDLNCPEAVPAAVLYDPDPVQGISVWPDVQDPFEEVEGVDSIFDDVPLDRVVVAGADGLLRDFDGEGLQLTWVTADGTRWMAMSSGFTRDETIEVLDALTFDGFTLDPSSVPADLTTASVSTVPSTTTVTSWEAWYGETADQPADDPSIVNLRTTTAYTAPIEVKASIYARGTAFTEVNGDLAVFTVNAPDLASAGFAWLKWSRDGVRYDLNGYGTLDELVALAERIEHVSLDDPRVVGTPSLDEEPGR